MVSQNFSAQQTFDFIAHLNQEIARPHPVWPSFPSSQVDENYDQSEERTEEPADGAEVKVWGNMVAFVERLDDEMFKSLQVGGWAGFEACVGVLS